MEIPARSVARAAYVAAALNLAASIAMAIWLQPGLPLPGIALEERAAYVARQGPGWWGGWLLWHAAAVSLLALYAGLAGLWRRGGPIRCALALLCAAAGLAADLSAEAIYIAIAPRSRPDLFPLIERVSGLLTGYVGNGLYTLGGILLTWAGARELPRSLLMLGGCVWAAGLLLCAASLLESACAQAWSAAILMPLFIAWCALLGRWLGPRSS